MSSEHLLRAHLAPEPRTLVDIVRATAAAYPEAAAIDDGEVLTYSELLEEVEAKAAELHALGIGRGSRVGIRMTSGSKDLYVAILATLFAGAAYVPVDADDPEERAALVFGEAKVDVVFGDAGITGGVGGGGVGEGVDKQEPLLDSDAWIIFTSGSTGTPKGVAVTHRSAAAFVDAEARLFCQDEPLGPEDRVLAGLSVAFDASCEEMWLAWRNGACLVPAPRSLVRSGQDLGPWLIRRDITVVSTVPTLAGLWPAEALDHVRLLIVGGEACSQELADRLSNGREMWNTYGPTEATVVASAARLEPGKPVTIGWALDGWDLAISSDGQGDQGELIIGGVGLARYLDPAKDAEKYASWDSGDVHWPRAYRTGDHVRVTDEGLAFIGRADDQVKIGGRRIELGEVEANVAALEGVYNSAVAVQTLGSGDKVLVGYVSPEDGVSLDVASMRAALAEVMPAALVPRMHVMDELPIRTSGKVDKNALPWPLPATVAVEGLSPTEQWIAGLWVEVLGVDVPGADADFFALGGTSLAAAALVTRLRERVPTFAVRDLYDHPRLGALALLIDDHSSTPSLPQRERTVSPVDAGVRLRQFALLLPVVTLRAATPLVWFLLAFSLLSPVAAFPVMLVAWLLFCTPVGRVPLGAWGARLIRGRVAPGVYPRGGSVHLRMWAAEKWLAASGALNISGTPFVKPMARMMGNKIGRDVDFQTIPPVSGLLTVESGASVEPGVDMSGAWLDGASFHVGSVFVGSDARIGARSTLMGGTEVRAGAHVEAGSTVTGVKPVKKGARWAGSPARKVGKSGKTAAVFPDTRPPRRGYWVVLYALAALVLASLPFAAAVAGIWVGVFLLASEGLGLVASTAAGGLVYFFVSLLLTWVFVRLAQLAVRPGTHPVRSLPGLGLWMVVRLLDDSRYRHFPLYASLLTPLWFRSLGATIGKGAEISTAVMVPKLSDVRDSSFLADDTLLGAYELSGGWVHCAPASVGRRSFLGNSGIVAPGRKLAKKSLVAVLSSAPRKSKAESNWWGSPPERMRRVAVAAEGGDAATFEPTFGMKARRGFVETLRLLAPAVHGMLYALFALGVASMLDLLGSWGLGGGGSLGGNGLLEGAVLIVVALLLGGVLWMAVGAVALLVTVLFKWILVRRHKAGEHPLYSWFVWLNELQDQFVEMIAAPWFFNWAGGSGAMNVALRLLGVNVGRGAWIESYWFPETDLCTVGSGATVGPGTVVQTHLFQDRVMSLDAVTIGSGATLGLNSVILPGATIEAGATIGPGSLVMRGDTIPTNTQWQGNPVEPVR
ncbi:AMP-binding protein [Corynebacterium riegelii]|uniref:Pls/PosA family non-ribosomal peptide synthetase n=1 Tax=Corynebacterium riegelii TaxID=156976 RepID=UPI00254C8CAC|nr:Pls/PosA family non-ribosomal peptide synthetase [Corynebacterium riegelii]MDK7180638.1 AMP-binding protein [Corynebacterium riegelii]